MKKIFFAFVVIIMVAAACDRTIQKDEVKNDDIILAPESNSNLTDTHPVITDSSGIDSSHLKADSLATR